MTSWLWKILKLHWNFNFETAKYFQGFWLVPLVLKLIHRSYCVLFHSEIASDGLKGRVFEMAQADLNNDEVSFRKFKLICEDVQGHNCMTNFHGMTMTTDKLRSLVKKWQTCIEAHVDVKTTDGYLLRLFAIGFTKKRQNSVKKTAYAKTTQVRAIRKKMVEIITREVSTKDLKDVVNKLLPDSMGSDIEKASQGIYPLHDCFIRKVKCLKKPKFDGKTSISFCCLNCFRM